MSSVNNINFIGRSRARICAVQILYQYFYLKNTIDAAMDNTLKIIKQDPMNDDRVLINNHNKNVSNLDKEFLSRLLHGTLDNRSQIMTVITQCLSAKYQWSDLDIILSFILQLGAYEIMYCQDIQIKVVISQYILVTKSYFSGNEYSLVNFILDQIRLHQNK